MAKFKALIKLRRQLSPIQAQEYTHNYDEKGFKPNSFALAKEQIDSITARSQQCSQPHGRGSGGNLRGAWICQGGKQKKN